MATILSSAAVCLVLPDAPAVFQHDDVRFVAFSASCRGRGGRKFQGNSGGDSFGIPLCAQADRPFLINFPACSLCAAMAAAHCS